jgi:hypothetical protein
VIGAEDLRRFCDTTSQIAGGNVRAQMEAWGIDHDEFFGFAAAWSNAYCEATGVDPRQVLTVLFIGFELGYRACAEQPVEAAPDTLGELAMRACAGCGRATTHPTGICEDCT